MDKATRLKMIAANEAARDANISDRAERQARNEAAGIFGPLPREKRAAPDMVFKRRNDGLQQPAIGNAEDALLALADEVGIVTGRMERELRLEISALLVRVEKLERGRNA